MCPKGTLSIYDNGSSTLTAHWNHPGSFTKCWCLGLIPWDSHLMGVLCSPGTGNFKSFQLTLMCSQGWVALANDFFRNLRNVLWIDFNFMEKREHTFPVCKMYSIKPTWQAKFTKSYFDLHTNFFVNLQEVSNLQKSTGNHFSILAWRIPWAEEPGGLQSIGSWRVGHNIINLARTHAQEVSKHQNVG